MKYAFSLFSLAKSIYSICRLCICIYTRLEHLCVLLQESGEMITVIKEQFCYFVSMRQRAANIIGDGTKHNAHQTMRFKDLCCT